MGPDDYVTDGACHERSGNILAAIERLERRLYYDNGTLSVQTRLDRQQQRLELVSRMVFGTAGLILIAVIGAVVALVVQGP